MRLFWLILVVMTVFLFNIFSMPLERIPSDVFSYVWSAVILVKIVEIGYRHFTKHKIKVFKWLDPVLMGLLIVSLIASVTWTPFSGQLITDLFVALSPLFLFFNKWGKEGEFDG